MIGQSARPARRRPSRSLVRSRSASRGRRAIAGDEEVVDALLVRAARTVRPHARLGAAGGLGDRRHGSPARRRRSGGAPRRRIERRAGSCSRTPDPPVDAAAPDVEVAEHQDRVGGAVHLVTHERASSSIWRRRTAPCSWPACRCVTNTSITSSPRASRAQHALGREHVLLGGVPVDMAGGGARSAAGWRAQARCPPAAATIRPRRRAPRRTRTCGRTAGARACRRRAPRVSSRSNSSRRRSSLMVSCRRRCRSTRGARRSPRRAR